MPDLTHPFIYALTIFAVCAPVIAAAGPVTDWVLWHGAGVWRRFYLWLLGSDQP